MAEKDAFVIFDEAYEGNDVDAFYLGDILRALDCTLTNKSVAELGGTAELGVSRIKFADFAPILAKAKGITGDTGCKEDYIEGLNPLPPTEILGKTNSAESCFIQINAQYSLSSDYC